MVDFPTIKPGQTGDVKDGVTRKRITKRDIKSGEVAFTLQELYDPADNTYKFKGVDGTAIMTIDPVAGTLTLGKDLVITTNVTISGTFDASGTITNANNRYITAGTEFYMLINFEHTFTGSSTYQDNTGSRFTIDVDDFPGFDIYYQATMAVEAATRVAYSRIYNITDTAVVANSEITNDVVGITGQTPDMVRSSSAITLVSGSKDYIVQRKQVAAGNGGDNMHMYLGHLVFVKT